MNNYYRWQTEFIRELQVQDVPGDRIGAAVAEVESHLTESGQDVYEAFGDPKDYARSLRLPQRSLAWKKMFSGGYLIMLMPGTTLLSPSLAALLRGKMQTNFQLFYILQYSFLIILMIAILLIFKSYQQRRMSMPKAWIIAIIVVLAAGFIAIWRFMDRMIVVPTLVICIPALCSMAAGAWLGWTQPGRNPVTYPDHPTTSSGKGELYVFRGIVVVMLFMTAISVIPHVIHPMP